MKALLKEADIERTCTELLELDGWRSLKTDPVSRREWGKGFGEKGMADRLYVRYFNSTQGNAECGQFYGQVRAEVMWIEWKRSACTALLPRKRLTAVPRATKAAGHQVEWQSRERGLGAPVLCAGVDFPASIEGFMEWYRGSGLARRVS